MPAFFPVISILRSGHLECYHLVARDRKWSIANPEPGSSLGSVLTGARINTQDDDGKTALIHAAEKGLRNIVASLIRSGSQSTK